MATVCPASEKAKASLENKPGEGLLPGVLGVRLGANEANRSHHGSGASWSPPMCDLRSFGRTQASGGVVRDENSLVFSLLRLSLLFLDHHRPSCVLARTGEDDPGAEGLAGLLSNSVSFSHLPGMGAWSSGRDAPESPLPMPCDRLVFHCPSLLSDR